MAKNAKSELKAAKKPQKVAPKSKKITKKVKPEKASEKVQQVKPKPENAASAEKLAKKKALKIAQQLKKKQQKAEGKVEEKSPQQKPQSPKKNQVKPDAAAKENGTPTKSTPKLKPKKKPTKKMADKPIIKLEDPAVLAATLFVGNLPVNTKNVQLFRLFNDFAPVHSVRVRTANGKKLFKHAMRKEASSLIAYVVLKDAETAQRALSLNGSDFKGNHIRVTLAEKKAPTDTKRTVVVGNLKYTANEEKLREIFSSCGEIEYVRCLQASAEEIAAVTNKEVKAGCKGVAYVTFKSADAVGLALELKETMLDERPINVERYIIKKQGAKKAREATKKSAQPTKKGKNAKKSKTKIAAGADETDKKKAVFRGVKIDKIKKKKTINKGDKKLKQMAKKIAPKSLLKT